MKLVITAVGRAKAATPEQTLFETYVERAQELGPRLGFTKIETAIVDTSRAATESARREDEAERLSAKIPKGAFLIALDERGKSFESAEFAKLLAGKRDAARDVAFLIGGPDGLAPSLRDAAAWNTAFGRQTWPHMLVRVMLAEQIYRAFSILAGHPYHRV
jgi:23S rRNA (pseudouridine1915-N3)-methyltransferase